jgi:hypothetical protein
MGFFVQVGLGSVRVGSPFIVILNKGCRESDGPTKVVDLMHDRGARAFARLNTLGRDLGFRVGWAVKDSNLRPWD